MKRPTQCRLTRRPAERRADLYSSRRISRGYPGESLIRRVSALCYAMPVAKRRYVDTRRILRLGAKLDVRTYWNRFLARTGTTLAKHRRSAWERRWRLLIIVVQTLILLSFILERVKAYSRGTPDKCETSACLWAIFSMFGTYLALEWLAKVKPCFDVHPEPPD